MASYRRISLCAVLLLAACIAGGPVGCQEEGVSAGPGAGPGAPDKPTVTRAAPKARPDDDLLAALMENFRWDEFEQMIAVLELTGDHERAFRQNMADRAAKLEEYRASGEAKEAKRMANELREARRSDDEAKIAELDKKYTPTIDKHQARMEDLRRIVMGPLSPQQRR